jgi:hypothetical protein
MQLPVIIILLFMNYSKMLSIAHIIQCLMMDNYKIRNDTEGSGHCLISNAIPTFAKTD